MNRLEDQTSPYLLQHAGNPVHWQPWDEQALCLARDLDRPIFLSIGYSACHWCHVMEHESFSDPGIADALNRNFVPIKVDREERPDVDDQYMLAVQALTGAGGWPLSVFLTPELQPFFGGTYFPPVARQGMPGFGDVLDAMAQAWRDRRADVRTAAAGLVRHLRESAAGAPADCTAFTTADFARSGRDLTGMLDEQGGLRGAPKFPNPGAILFLLRHHRAARSVESAAHARAWLHAMAAGGIRDHVGGGFHRYAVDADWTVPHFEKMLYDQALLAQAYLEGWLCLREPAYRRVAEETLEFVLRELRDPRGGFRAALDADSPDGEGVFYTWTPDELRAALGDAEGAWACEALGVTRTGQVDGRSVLTRRTDADPVRLNALLARLHEVRSRRTRPACDTKVLAGWNGLMVETLANAGALWENPRYAEAASTALQFLLDRGCAGGAVQHAAGHGQEIPGLLEDYAALGLACAAVGATASVPDLLAKSIDLTDAMLARFGDEGALFQVAADQPVPVARLRPRLDLPVPSGNALAARLLDRAFRLTGNRRYAEVRDGIFAACAGAMRDHAYGVAYLLCAWHDAVVAPRDVVVAGTGTEYVAMLRAARSEYEPGRWVLGAGVTDADRPALLAGKSVHAGAGAFVCAAGTCAAPVRDMVGLARALRDSLGGETRR